MTCIIIGLLFVYVFALAWILDPLDAAESPLLDAQKGTIKWPQTIIFHLITLTFVFVVLVEMYLSSCLI